MESPVLPTDTLEARLAEWRAAEAAYWASAHADISQHAVLLHLALSDLSEQQLSTDAWFPEGQRLYQAVQAVWTWGVERNAECLQLQRVTRQHTNRTGIY